MEYRVLETRSADILTKYYNNEINSFLIMPVMKTFCG